MRSQCLSESWDLLKLLVLKTALECDTVCSPTCVTAPGATAPIPNQDDYQVFIFFLGTGKKKAEMVNEQVCGQKRGRLER